MPCCTPGKQTIIAVAERELKLRMARLDLGACLPDAFGGGGDDGSSGSNGSTGGDDGSSGSSDSNNNSHKPSKRRRTEGANKQHLML